ATTFAALAPGGGVARTDCLAESQVLNPSNTPFLDTHGRVNNVQTCHDGDPLCDAEGAVDGSCTFRVAVCLDVSDAGLPACGAIGIRAYRVTSPTPPVKSAVDRGNALVLLARSF